MRYERWNRAETTLGVEDFTQGCRALIVDSLRCSLGLVGFLLIFEALGARFLFIVVHVLEEIQTIAVAVLILLRGFQIHAKVRELLFVLATTLVLTL